MSYINEHHTYTDPAAYDARSQTILEQLNKKAWESVIQKTGKEYISAQDVVCDFGCGTLAHFQAMGQAKKIYAIDNNQSMLDAGMRKLSAKQRGKVIPIVSDACHTSIPDTACSVVWSIGLTEYTDIDRLFQEMYRVSTPQAVLILQFPWAGNPLHILIRIVNFFRNKKTKQFRYISEIRRVATSHGWRIKSIQSAFIRNNMWCVLQKSNPE